MNNKWDLADLKVFVSVAKRSSFAAAAADLGLSPASVSQRIAALESALGVTLFLRTTRRVHITEVGEVAYERARRVLEAADEMAHEVASTKTSPSGSLRISTSLRLGRNHVSHVLSMLEKEYPKLQLWLELVDRPVDVIAEGFDIDIRVGDVNEPYLIAHPIARSSRILCAAPSYLERRGEPKTLQELAQHDCLLFRSRDESFGVWRMEGPNGPESVKVTGPVASNHSDVVRNWVLDGHGIILLSIWDIAARIKDGSLVRVLPAYKQRADVWAVTPARLSSSAKLQVCVEFLIRHLTEGKFALDTSIA